MPKQLSDLDAAEVSIVKRGANKKKVLLLKKDANAERTALLEAISQDPPTMQEVEKALAEGVDNNERAALKAVVKILTPFKEKGLPLSKILKAAGMEEMCKDEGRESGENVDEDEDEVIGKAKKDTDLEGDADTLNAKPGKKKPEGDEMPEDKKDAVSKADLETILKSQQETNEKLAAQNKELVEKADKQAIELAEVKKSARLKDFVAKAEGFKHLGTPTQELASDLMGLADHNQKLYDSVVKHLEVADKAMADGIVFKELGSGQGNSAAKGSMEAITKSAMAMVAKSGEKVSEAQAVTKFLETEEGARMYAEYNKSKGM